VRKRGALWAADERNKDGGLPEMAKQLGIRSLGRVARRIPQNQRAPRGVTEAGRLDFAKGEAGAEWTPIAELLS
jgi:hypothetical protein